MGNLNSLIENEDSNSQQIENFKNQYTPNGEMNSKVLTDLINSKRAEIIDLENVINLSNIEQNNLEDILREIESQRNSIALLNQNNQCSQEDLEKINNLAEAKQKLNKAIADKNRIINEINRLEKLKKESEEAEETRRKDLEFRINRAKNAKPSINFVPKILDSQEAENNKLQLSNTLLTNSNYVDESDKKINDIYMHHYNTHIKTFMKNKIVLDKLNYELNKLNSEIQYNNNKKQTYNANGEITFY